MFKSTSLIRKELNQLFIISLGAVPGAFIRWNLSNVLVVNVLGALVLGFLFGLSSKRRAHLIFGVGFCGALTTFSGWMLDSAKLLLGGYLIQAFGVIIYTFFLGLLSGFLGFLIGKCIKKSRLFL